LGVVREHLLKEFIPHSKGINWEKIFFHLDFISFFLVVKYFKNPLNISEKLYYESVMIIQPVDFLQDERQNMCDGCPDITV